ncbi:MAG: thiamine pyrophosphate-dependent dehydrogenase E1 component subunit alpha, partial [Chloroflexota bacterium]
MAMPEIAVQPQPVIAGLGNASDFTLSAEDLLRIYRAMVLTRALDDKAWTLNRQGRISFVASPRGHEAAQVASAYALRPGHDIFFTYYRDVAVALLLGMEPLDLLLSSFGKPNPINGSGRHLPWHLVHPGLKLMPATSVVASQIPQAAGSALASKLKGDGAVTMVYFGDGATSEGDFHEGMNWAGIHRLPMIFFCENNGYAISVPSGRQMPVPHVIDRAAAYGFAGVRVDGADVEAVYHATARAVQHARRGDGPTLIEANVERLRAHSSDDDDRRYRPDEELRRLPERDPLPALRDRLLAR